MSKTYNFSLPLNVQYGINSLRYLGADIWSLLQKIETFSPFEKKKLKNKLQVNVHVNYGSLFSKMQVF